MDRFLMLKLLILLCWY